MNTLSREEEESVSTQLGVPFRIDDVEYELQNLDFVEKNKQHLNMLKDMTKTQRLWKAIEPK